MDIIIIDSNQSFNKIFFRKILTAGVYTDKNLGNIFFLFRKQLTFMNAYLFFTYKSPESVSESKKYFSVLF